MGTYNLNFTYLFRTDHLALDYWLVCSSLGRVIPPVTSVIQFSIVLWVLLRPPGSPPPPQFVNFISFLIVQWVFGYLYDLVCENKLIISSEVARTHYHTVLIFWFLHCLYSLFSYFPRALGVGLFCRCIHWD